MSKLDKEDKLLLGLTILFLIGTIICLTVGFYIYPTIKEWDMYYWILTLSVGIFSLFSLLSLIMKKRKK